MNETFAKLKVSERWAAEETTFTEWVAAGLASVVKYSKALPDAKSAIEGN